MDFKNLHIEAKRDHVFEKENVFPNNLKMERLETENGNTPKQLSENLNTPIFNLPNTEKEKNRRRSSHLIDAFTLNNSTKKYRNLTIGSTFQKKENSSSFGDNLLTITKEQKEAKAEGESFRVIKKEFENLKNCLEEFESIIEDEKKEKTRLSQISRILDENNNEKHFEFDNGTTLPLNEITSGNQSYACENNTPSQWKFRNRERDSFCLLGSNITTKSVDFQQVSQIRAKSEINESIFLKSHEFPRYLKRKTKKSYTKMLVPVSDIF